MIKATYHFIHRTIVALTLISIVGIILLTHQYTLVLLAEKFLKSNHIEYSKIQGSLFDGVTLYDLKYKNIMQAQKVHINYKLLSFIKLKPIIKEIQTQQLFFNYDALQKSTQKTQSLQIMPFLILKTEMQQTHLIVNKKDYFFDLKMKNLFYDSDTFTSNSLLVKLKSYYANATIHAKITKNRIIAHSDNVELTHRVRNHYLHFLQNEPRYLRADMNLSRQSIDLTTDVAAFTLTSNSDVCVKNQKLRLSYLINKKIFTLKSRYELLYKNYLSKIQQSGTFNIHGEYNTTLHADFINFPKSVPINAVDTNFYGDTKQIKLDANSSNYFLHLSSNDYNKYKIRLTNEKLKLTFVDSLPTKVQNHQFSLDSYSTVLLSPFSADTLFHTTDNFANIIGTFHYKEGYRQLAGKIKPNLDNPLYKDYNLNSLLPIEFEFMHKGDKKYFKLDANQFQAQIIKNKNNELHGKGYYASAFFDLKGDIDTNNNVNINLSTTIPSIKQLLKDTNLSSINDQSIYDGEVHIHSNIHIKEFFSINSTITAPFLSLKTDSQNLYILKDVRLRTSYKNKKINIYNYSAKYREQKFYSQKTSHIHVDHDLIFYVEEFYIYDNLVLRGVIEPFKSDMELNIHSDKFALQTKDFDVIAKTNINIHVQNTQRQLIDGNITLLSGTVSYQPQHDYTISDDDIIIVQDMQRRKKNNIALHLNINAANPLQYKTKDINVHFIPAIVLKKEAGETVRVLGKITILDGSIVTQSKAFSFDKSELIFLGERQLNPELNIKLHYQTIDYKDIIILISNRLNSPVFIFSSNPAMSQNDIMSYILFDEPASTLFDNSEQSNKASINYLLLGTGIKTIFNKTTGIHVDTLNILNNKNGTLGYEVGARLNKKIRILYKNDISSSMILQYNLKRSFRIDVDVHDTGQGVYFIYTKDLEGF